MGEAGTKENNQTAISDMKEIKGKGGNEDKRRENRLNVDRTNVQKRKKIRSTTESREKNE